MAATNALEPIEGTEGTRRPIVAHHFNNLLQQQASVRFGMWLFLATELLFFGGVICAYTVYRIWFPKDFEAASTALNPLIAGINSFLLLTSSFTCTLAIRAAYEGKQGMLKTWLAATILLGVTFLGFKAFEYYTDYKEGLIPSNKLVYNDPRSHNSQSTTVHQTGNTTEFAHNLEHVLKDKEYYKDGKNLGEVNLDRCRLFFVFYYAMTGLHVLHMVIGIGLFTWQYILASLGFFVPQERYVYVEVLALYWHFVELVWIFLLPLLYMAGHHNFANLGF